MLAFLGEGSGRDEGAAGGEEGKRADRGTNGRNFFCAQAYNLKSTCANKYDILH
jgi:hypothetical protein